MVSLLPTLIGQKQSKENRVLSVATIAAETEIPKQTIYNWLNGDIRRFDADIIEKLCAYFNCDVGDLLTIQSIRRN